MGIWTIQGLSPAGALTLTETGRKIGSLWKMGGIVPNNAEVVSVVSRGVLGVLLAGAVLLPIAILLVVATSFVFAGLQDAVAARALNAGAFVLGLLWILDLVALVLALAVDAVARQHSAAERRSDEE